MPGFGSPSYQGSATQTPTVTGSVTITIANTATTPSTGGTGFNTSGGPAPTSGKWHMRKVAANGTPTTALVVTVTDGTNTWTVANIPATAGEANADFTGEFKTDVSITSVAFVIASTGSSNSLPYDCEVSLT